METHGRDADAADEEDEAVGVREAVDRHGPVGAVEVGAGAHRGGLDPPGEVAEGLHGELDPRRRLARGGDGEGVLGGGEGASRPG